MILMLVRECLFEHVFLKCQISSDWTTVFGTVGLCTTTTTIGSASTRGEARFVELEI